MKNCFGYDIGDHGTGRADSQLKLCISEGVRKAVLSQGKNPRAAPIRGFIFYPWGTSLAFYRGQKGLSLENPRKKSEKGFPGALGPGAEKARK